MERHEVIAKLREYGWVTYGDEPKEELRWMLEQCELPPKPQPPGPSEEELKASCSKFLHSQRNSKRRKAEAYREIINHRTGIRVGEEWYIDLLIKTFGEPPEGMK